MPPPVIQVVQERWFQPPPTQAPQQFHYQPPVLPKQEQNTSWESMTAPVENPVGQVVGDLMQQGIEPTEMQGLSARELASIRDSLTSEKVATSTQTIEPAFFAPFTDTREKGTQSAPSTLPISTQTWADQKTFGGQTEPPSQTTFASQTDAPGSFGITVGTQIGRRLPREQALPAIPEAPERRPLSFSDTVQVLNIPPVPYEKMSIEELRVAVRFRVGDGAGNLLKPALLKILNAEDPVLELARAKKGKAIELASPADSAFEGVIKSNKKKRPEIELYEAPPKRPTSTRIVQL
jgi:hypothetical protein